MSLVWIPSRDDIKHLEKELYQHLLAEADKFNTVNKSLYMLINVCINLKDNLQTICI